MSTYVYGIVRACEARLPEGLRGIGDPPGDLRLIEQGDLAAVVGDAPAQIRPKRRDLLAHQTVLSEVNASGPVLPMRFGNVSADDDAVRAVLADRADHWLERLHSLAGRAEYNVKAAHDSDAVLHRVLAEEPAIRALSAANRAAGGGSHEDKLRLGELVAMAVRDREERDARLVRQTLESAAEDVRPGPESTGWLANISFLVTVEEAGRFQSAVDEFAAAHPGLELRVNGPLSPYSFVETAETAETAAPVGPTEPVERIEPVEPVEPVGTETDAAPARLG